MTFNLIKNYIDFRNKNKFKIFNELFLKKLDLQLSDHKEENKEYDNTLLFLKNFYKWFINNNETNNNEKNNEILDKIGIEIKTRCQTWLRQIPNYDYGKDGVTLCAHNTIPVPHFQTVFRIKDDKLFLYNIKNYIATITQNSYTEETFIDGYKNLIYFFTRGMRDGYGTTYPIQITTVDGLYYTEPDDIYNGNAFIDVDDFYNNYVPSSVEPLKLANVIQGRKNRGNARVSNGLTFAKRKAKATAKATANAANSTANATAKATANPSRNAAPTSRITRFGNGISRRVGNAKAGIFRRFGNAKASTQRLYTRLTKRNRGSL